MKAILRLADHWASPTRTAVGHERHFCGVGGESAYPSNSLWERIFYIGSDVPTGYIT